MAILINRRNYRIALWVFLCALIPAAAAKADNGFVQVRGTQLVDGAGQPLFLRGIGLGNWLLAEGYMWHFKHAVGPRQIHEVVAELIGDAGARRFWAEWRERYITAADVRLIRELGFNSVRLPLHHGLFIDPARPDEPTGPGWALLDRFLGWCKAEGIYVVLDLHGAPGGQTGTGIDDSPGYPFLFVDAESQDLTVALWRQLATRYRDEPIVLGYDLLNEPIADFFDQDRLNPRLAPLYRRLIAAIREVDPHHLIMLGGAQWNTNFEAAGEPSAPNLVYTFHTYWTDPTEKSIAPYLAYREKHQVPLYLGEAGENTDEWIQKFRALMEEHRIDWCFWPYKKMDATSSVLSIHPPEGWEVVRAFADAPRGSYEEIRAARPPEAVSARALQQLLENLSLERCRLNEGYVRALGLKVPAKAE